MNIKIVAFAESKNFQYITWYGNNDNEQLVICRRIWIVLNSTQQKKNVSEYDQEMPTSQNADQPTAP